MDILHFKVSPNLKKCLPLVRDWPGTRCERCVKYKYSCSEPQTSEATKTDRRDQSALHDLTSESQQQSSVSKGSLATPDSASHPSLSSQHERIQAAMHPGREKRVTRQLLTRRAESIARDSHYSGSPEVTLGGGQGNSLSKDDVASVSKKVLSSIGRPGFSVPFPRDNCFTGREDILSFMKEQIKSRHRVTLYGIGGVGYCTFIQH